MHHSVMRGKRWASVSLFPHHAIQCGRESTSPALWFQAPVGWGWLEKCSLPVCWLGAWMLYEDTLSRVDSPKTCFLVYSFYPWKPVDYNRLSELLVIWVEKYAAWVIWRSNHFGIIVAQVDLSKKKKNKKQRCLSGQAGFMQIEWLTALEKSKNQSCGQSQIILSSVRSPEKRR